MNEYELEQEYVHYLLRAIVGEKAYKKSGGYLIPCWNELVNTDKAKEWIANRKKELATIIPELPEEKQITTLFGIPVVWKDSPERKGTIIVGRYNYIDDNEV